MKTNGSLPSFPDDLPTAPIARISLARLEASDAVECQKVLDACCSYGFFYLQLDNETGKALLEESEQLLILSNEVFSFPLEEKMKYAAVHSKSQMGYKAPGTVKQTDPDKRPDSTEFYNISKDHLWGLEESREYPPQIIAKKAAVQTFMGDAHACGMLLLTVLARSLGLLETDFVDRHNFSAISTDHVRLTKTPAHYEIPDSIGLPSHTDFGSITILFNWLGGLQIQSRDPARLGDWEFVRPLAGHAIINLGDAMVKFTNGRLNSAKHRVVPAPGEQSQFDRYSIVYFVRPAQDTLMVPLDKFLIDRQSTVQVGGKVGDDNIYTAGEWIRKRYRSMGA